MNAIRTLIALSVPSLVAACAGPGTIHAAPASHGMSNIAEPMPMAATAPRMHAMQEMHQNMMAAKTPAERQALMADHKAVMQMMMDMMADRMPAAPASK